MSNSFFPLFIACAERYDSSFSRVVRLPMCPSFELKFRFLRASSDIRLPTSFECPAHDFGHEPSTCPTFSRIISHSLSASAPTVSFSPVQANDSAKIPP